MASILVVMVVFGVVAATPAVADDVKRYSREEVKEIFCKGRYPFHVQGVATDGTNVYWSYTTVLVKTDMSGSVLAKYERENIHMGDITWHAGRVYAGINGYRPSGDEIWVFDDAALTREKVVKTPETLFCNNGIEWSDGRFFVIGSMPKHTRYNMLFEYDEELRFKGARLVDSGWTLGGLQTIFRAGSYLMCGYYGTFKDKEMPHPSGTFALKADDLPIGRKSRESAPPVPIIERDLDYTGEGGIFLNGAVWVVKGIMLKNSAVLEDREWSARLIPSSRLTAFVNSRKNELK